MCLSYLLHTYTIHKNNHISKEKHLIFFLIESLHRVSLWSTYRSFLGCPYCCSRYRSKFSISQKYIRKVCKKGIAGIFKDKTSTHSVYHTCMYIAGMYRMCCCVCVGRLGTQYIKQIQIK